MEISRELKMWFAKLIQIFVKSDSNLNNPRLTWNNAHQLYKKNMSPEQAAKTLNTMTEDFKLGNVIVKPFGDQELRDYITRIRANSFVKGKSDWNKDKLSMPHFHNSQIGDITADENGNGFDKAKTVTGKDINIDMLKKLLKSRPDRILMSNAKMEHSTEMVYTIGMPALKGMAVDEETNELYIVDTCPGAGTCKMDCYAMKGSFIVVKGKSMRYHRLLTWILNDPDGFKARVVKEIESKKKKAERAGIDLVIRWHDTGDFFSPDYLQIAIDIANQFPDVLFAAYTKVGSAASADLPNNFINNFSIGAKPKEVDQVDLNKVKLSVIIPKHIFKPHISRAIKYDEQRVKLDTQNGRMTTKGIQQRDKFYDTLANKKNLPLAKVKKEYPLVWTYKSDSDWKQVQTKIANAINNKSVEIKGAKNQVLPKYILDRYQFNVDPSSIIKWEDMIKMPKGEEELKWNVVVLPNTDGDDAAQRKDVWMSLLLFH